MYTRNIKSELQTPFYPILGHPKFVFGLQGATFMFLFDSDMYSALY